MSPDPDPEDDRDDLRRDDTPTPRTPKELRDRLDKIRERRSARTELPDGKLHLFWRDDVDKWPDPDAGDDVERWIIRDPADGAEYVIDLIDLWTRHVGPREDPDHVLGEHEDNPDPECESCVREGRIEDGE